MGMNKPKYHFLIGSRGPANKKQLQASKENFFLFRMKGLVSNVNQMLFVFRDKDENLEKVRENVGYAVEYLTLAENYFKQYQKDRIQKDKEEKK